MHTEFAHYVASLRLLQQLRWAFAGCLAYGAIQLYKRSAKLMPEAHPTKGYMLARIDAAERTVLPAMGIGLCPKIKRLGQGIILASLIALIFLLVVGGARTEHHVRHMKQERAVDLFNK